MSRKTVCIEREYGSNGRKIAEWLSKKTGIPLYDKKALTKTAQDNHLMPEGNESDENTIPDMHREAIKFLADKGSCIFVGTCAAGVLQGRDKNINVFVKADMESKIRWAMESENMDRQTAEEKRDIYSVTECGDKVEYDLIVASSRFGIEGTADMIRACLARF